MKSCSRGRVEQAERRKVADISLRRIRGRSRRLPTRCSKDASTKKLRHECNVIGAFDGAFLGVTSGLYADWLFYLDLHRGKPGVTIRLLAIDDVEELIVDGLCDRSHRAVAYQIAID